MKTDIIVGKGEKAMLTDKLTSIEVCIQNDLRAIENLNYHLVALYKMRSEELAARGITEQEWEEGLEELRTRWKKN